MSGMPVEDRVPTTGAVLSNRGRGFIEQKVTVECLDCGHTVTMERPLKADYHYDLPKTFKCSVCKNNGKVLG